MPSSVSRLPRVAIIGGGPAGLMAADILTQHRVQVDIYEAMPSLGRKFLMAGKGGMNITHAEPYTDFLDRYGKHRNNIEPLLNSFTPTDLRAWIHDLGIDTFVGTSGRVFPTDMKAAPLLRAWLHRLREAGVQIHARHRWQGWDSEHLLRFSTPEHEFSLAVDAVILALGGGSWPQLGSDGAWVKTLAPLDIPISPLRPSNCGFNVSWSPYFQERFASTPLKSITATFQDIHKKGECLITEHGIEGGLIYNFSAAIRDEIEANGQATLYLDLLPDWSAQRVSDEIHHPRGSRSLSSHLQSRLGLKGVKVNLLREILGAQNFNNLTMLASTIKHLPLSLISPRPLAESISSAGGIKFEALDQNLMLKKLPGVFCAGEMLDWEAPTGGYLLSACFASGRAAGLGTLNWLKSLSPP